MLQGVERPADVGTMAAAPMAGPATTKVEAAMHSNNMAPATGAADLKGIGASLTGGAMPGVLSKFWPVVRVVECAAPSKKHEG